MGTVVRSSPELSIHQDVLPLAHLPPLPFLWFDAKKRKTMLIWSLSKQQLSQAFQQKREPEVSTPQITPHATLCRSTAASLSSPTVKDRKSPSAPKNRAQWPQHAAQEAKNMTKTRFERMTLWMLLTGITRATAAPLGRELGD